MFLYFIILRETNKIHVAFYIENFVVRNYCVLDAIIFTSVSILIEINL